MAAIYNNLYIPATYVITGFQIIIISSLVKTDLIMHPVDVLASLYEVQ